MDTLALLCTLHADGPASLQRLRVADLRSIDDVLGCSVETTSEVLGLSMAQARRFHREARMLAMRMHTEGLDREEQMYPGLPAMETAATQAAPALMTPTQTKPAASATMPAPAQAPPREGMCTKPDIAAILAPVLKKWEQDDVRGCEAPSAGVPQQTAITQAPTPESSAASELEALDGVDEELLQALRAAGYATVQGLAEVEPLTLSRTINRPYSEACRLRFLAQRALDAEDTIERPCAPEESLAAGSSSAETKADTTMTATSSEAEAEAGRILSDLVGYTSPESERFSAASPERKYPQDISGEEDAVGEGPGGPFA